MVTKVFVLVRDGGGGLVGSIIPNIMEGETGGGVDTLESAVLHVIGQKKQHYFFQQKLLIHV